MDDIELLRLVQAQQRSLLTKGDDESDEDFDSRQAARDALWDEWIGTLYYKANSVDWSHSKSVNYGNALLDVWEALRSIGVPCDGQTHAADAIRKFCALAKEKTSG